MNHVYAGFNMDPENGFSLRDAISMFATVPPLRDFNGNDVADRYHQLRLRQASRHLVLPASTRLSEHEAAELKGLERIFVECLIDRLRSGTLLATGFIPPSHVFDNIPPEWWGRVSLDLEGNSVDTAGMRVTEIRVFAVPVLQVPAREPEAVAMPAAPVVASAPISTMKQIPAFARAVSPKFAKFDYPLTLNLIECCERGEFDSDWAACLWAAENPDGPKVHGTGIAINRAKRLHTMCKAVRKSEQAGFQNIPESSSE